MNTSYLTPTDYRAEMLWDILPEYMGFTRTDLSEAVDAAVATVYEQYGYRPDLDNDSAWEIVLPFTLAYLSADHGIPLSDFDFIAY